MKILVYQGTKRQWRTAMMGYIWQIWEGNETIRFATEETWDKNYRPDVVIAPSDFHSLFEMQLMRWAKKIGAKTIAIQCSLYDRAKVISDFVDRENAQRMPMWLVKIRKHLGHLWVYWVKPLLNFEKPFWGKSSYILHTGQSGMRDADYQIVWNKHQYDILLKDGVPKEKLEIMPPLIYFKDNEKREKAITILVPNEFSVGNKHWECWKQVVHLLGNYILYVKQHPDGKYSPYLKNFPPPLINPKEPAERYIAKSDLVIGLPLALSTSLYIASLMGKKVIAFDPFHEPRGDFFKGWKGINYIDNYADLIQCAKAI